ncbi:MAG: flagellar biosynthetic protein FliR [Actinobacteria bacterium]|nr:flagellar biosynthetic protein FliR [Actinomycetota bacterium]
MQISLDAPWLIAFFLALVRASAWLMMVPPFSVSAVLPPQGVVGIAAGLAFLEAPRLVAAGGMPMDTASFIGAVVIQVLTGVALGFVVRTLISAISAAGSFASLFGGLALPPSMNVLENTQTLLFGQFYEMIAILLLFASNGEMLLVKGFMTSFNAPGLGLSASGQMAAVATSEVATFFVASLEIAAPILAVLFVAQVVIALMAKAAPQVNAWWLGLPLQVMLSLMLVAVGIRTMPAYLAQIVERSLSGMASLLR